MSRSLLPLSFFLLCTFALPARGHGPDAEPAPTDPALEAALTAQHGPGFLPALRAMGISAKDYAYAARLTSAGILKLKENDFQDARYLLEKAYSIVPSPNVLHWIGLTHLRSEERRVGEECRSRW